MVLLSLLYRVLAWKRGREVAAWLTANGMAGLPVENRSAENYGTLLAAELEQAMVSDEPLPVCQLPLLCSLMPSIRLFLLAGTSGASIASRCHVPPIGAGGMDVVEERGLPRSCRQP